MTTKRFLATAAISVSLVMAPLVPAQAAGPVVTTGHNIELNIRDRICNWFPFWC